MKKLTSFLIGILCISMSIFAQNIIYVNPSAMGSNNGTSWSNAYTKLQLAINNANSGDELRISTSHIMIDSTIHVVNKDLKIRGGYDVNTGVQMDSTTLDGNNVYVVIETQGLTVAAEFDHLVILNGRATVNINLPWSSSAGGGMHNEYSSPVIKNMRFAYNQALGNNASSVGGAIYNYYSSPQLFNVVFENNYAYDKGGALYNLQSSPLCTDIIFRNNSSYNFGGAMSNHTASPIMHNVVFEKNNSTKGGGIYLETNSNPYFNNVTFDSNYAYWGGGMLIEQNNKPVFESSIFTRNSAHTGGAIANNSYHDTLSNIIFQHNYATLNGGAMSNVNGAYPVLINLYFEDNYCVDSLNGAGGAIYNAYAWPTLMNVVFNHNTAAFGGAFFCSSTSVPVVNSTTFYQNQGSIAGGGIYIHDSFAKPIVRNTVFYDNSSDIEGYNINYQSTNNASDGNGGNISASTGFIALTSDPFVNSLLPAGSDGIPCNSDDGLIPSATSSLLNTGLNGTNMAYDITSNPRIINNTIDLGAYEFQAPVQQSVYESKAPFSLYPNPSNGVFKLACNETVKALHIYDNVGREIQYRVVQNGTHHLSQVENGMYILTWETEQGKKYSTQLFIQR